MVPVVFLGLWVFAPRVSIDDALRTAALFPAFVAPGTYLGLKARRKPPSQAGVPRASIHPAVPAVLGALMALYGLVPLNAGVDSYRETVGFVASEVHSAGDPQACPRHDIDRSALSVVDRILRSHRGPKGLWAGSTAGVASAVDLP